MDLTLHVISLRYSSWSMRALLPLWQAGADPVIKTVEPDFQAGRDCETVEDVELYMRQRADELARRRQLGSVNGQFPVLEVNGTRIHESLAICEWAAEHYPEAGLWPEEQIARARARAWSSEMVGGFQNMRTHLSCHPFARAPEFVPDGPTQVEIARVFEIWEQALQSSGGPFLCGDFGIVDAMYFPVLTRFETYGVQMPSQLLSYATALHSHPAVIRWRELAAQAPRIPMYDEYILGLGGHLDKQEAGLT